ncbi:hypothetical protein AAFF_G00262230 [Aldrovandia affinis]|uniref:Uncharacterized protein n=1 Tax=Aldrovandia affinis TaxID=143900 RepID=A0AAD7SSX0_9TELE|nr:hypothetical protein AAFF_G00262230 [Aldrovandia affinis]
MNGAPDNKSVHVSTATQTEQQKGHPPEAPSLPPLHTPFLLVGRVCSSCPGNRPLACQLAVDVHDGHSLPLLLFVSGAPRAFCPPPATRENILFRNVTRYGLGGLRVCVFAVTSAAVPPSTEALPFPGGAEPGRRGPQMFVGTSQSVNTA